MDRVCMLRALAFCTSIYLVVSSPCSSENVDLSDCLSHIVRNAKNDSRFWFGSSYFARCPNPYSSPDCINLFPYRAYSLVSRIFGTDYIFQESLVTKYVNVTFDTGTGSYSGCGNVWSVTESRKIELDPTQPMIYKPWSVRNRPTMTWLADQNELYTMIVFDAGVLINHGIFLNIPGNDVNRSEIFKDYSGPLPSSPTANVFAFLLFRQSGRINLSEEWTQKLSNSLTNMTSLSYTMRGAVEYLNLTGPVGMNWMEANMDPYSIQSMANFRIVYNCPYLISEAIGSHNRTFIPDNIVLTVNVDVTFSPSALSFSSCCAVYSMPSRVVRLNPLGSGKVDSWDVRSDADPIPDFTALGFYTQIKNFTGKTFTLLCVDPDVPNHTAGTRESPLLHWMVVNIPEGRMAEGDNVMSYRGPQPPDTAHYYYFLLYEQTNVINTNDTETYTTPPGSRFLFDISNFVSDNSLSLVGVTWFIAEPDEFTRYLYSTSGGNVTSLCAGQPNFESPCPTSGFAVWRLTLLEIVLFTTICILFSS
ncbi:uncharacterized protein LOC125676917 isoform X1 [Ostrea edulis]|uniref:uncharacterized protein LOC125676917 isoform X1 n=1 Tax=Ostrea edulis TaxID=37623 RepID=UPI0024AF88C8|nr:uncharacterized protein LOC125676917 isoform X1 [Ostrea edulis]